METEPKFHAGEPTIVMQVNAFPGVQRKYDVTGDGSRVLWNQIADHSSEAEPLTLMQGWEALLN